TWFSEDEVEEVLGANEDKGIYENQVFVSENNKRPHEQKFTSNKRINLKTSHKTGPLD
ncbi:11652_t:CDS:2, partial [Funneliformis caledonium]